jgi:hypothetical protein
MRKRERETVKKMQSWLVLLLPLFVMGQSALPMPLQLDDPGFRKILVQVDSLLIGGQPDSAAITQLPGRGGNDSYLFADAGRISQSQPFALCRGRPGC